MQAVALGVSLGAARAGNSGAASHAIDPLALENAPEITPESPHSRKIRSTPVTPSRWISMSRGTRRPPLAPERREVSCHRLLESWWPACSPSSSLRTHTEMEGVALGWPCPAKLAATSSDTADGRARPAASVRKTTDFMMLPFMCAVPCAPVSRSTAQLPLGASSRSTCALLLLYGVAPGV